MAGHPQFVNPHVVRRDGVTAGRVSLQQGTEAIRLLKWRSFAARDDGEIVGRIAPHRVLPVDDGEGPPLPRIDQDALTEEMAMHE
jgi:hypothetical protein